MMYIVLSLLHHRHAEIGVKYAYALILKTPHAVSVQSYYSVSSLESPSIKASIERPVEPFFGPS